MEPYEITGYAQQDQIGAAKLQAARQYNSGSVGSGPGDTRRNPLTADLMQALDSIRSLAEEAHGQLASKHSHLFGTVPAAPQPMNPVQSQSMRDGPESYEEALSGRLRSLNAIIADLHAVAFSLNQRL